MMASEYERLASELDLWATVELDGEQHGLEPEALLGCAVRGGFSSDWAVVNVVGSMRNRLGALLGREKGLELTAKLLRRSVQEVEAAMDGVAYELHCRDGMNPDAVHAWSGT